MSHKEVTRSMSVVAALRASRAQLAATRYASVGQAFGASSIAKQLSVTNVGAQLAARARYAYVDQQLAASIIATTMGLSPVDPAALDIDDDLKVPVWVRETVPTYLASLGCWAVVAFIVMTWAYLEQGALTAVLAALALYQVMPKDPWPTPGTRL